MGNKSWIWLLVGAAVGGLAAYMATRPKGKLKRINERAREQKLEDLAIA